jgi:hypothetical protein
MKRPPSIYQAVCTRERYYSKILIHFSSSDNFLRTQTIPNNEIEMSSDDNEHINSLTNSTTNRK